MKGLPDFPVIVTHLEDPPGSGLAACCGLPLPTLAPRPGSRLWLCTGCANAWKRKPQPLTIGPIGHTPGIECWCQSCELIAFFAERLTNVYDESPNLDYIHLARRITGHEIGGHRAKPKKHPDFYKIQRDAVVMERITERISAKEAAALLSRIDKAERDGIERDVTPRLMGRDFDLVNGRIERESS